jgi:uncharacterized coiled-coil DUF342 family protein
MQNLNNNGWDEVKNLINYKINELTEETKELKQSVQDLRDEVNVGLIKIASQSATKEELDCLKRDFNDLRVKYVADVTQLSVKASVWGGLAGLIPVLITIGIAVLTYILS